MRASHSESCGRCHSHPCACPGGNTLTLAELAALEGGSEPVREPQLTRLRQANVRRCEQIWRPLDGWAPHEWAFALNVEVGELSQQIFKLREDDDAGLHTMQRLDRIEQIAGELGDVLSYLDLLAASLGIDLWQATVHKFNAVSVRKGSNITLET